jgi:hypothetical protein
LKRLLLISLVLVFPIVAVLPASGAEATATDESITLDRFVYFIVDDDSHLSIPLELGAIR